jgi:hypothetical protein
MSSNPCIYQPREFARPSLERLSEIVRDELSTIATLLNDGCLMVPVENLPAPLPELVALDCCGIIVRRCDPGEPLDVAYTPLEDFVEEFTIKDVTTENTIHAPRGMVVSKLDSGNYRQRWWDYSGFGVQATLNGTFPSATIIEYRRDFDGEGNVISGPTAFPLTVWNSTTNWSAQPLLGSTTLSFVERNGYAEGRWAVNGIAAGENVALPFGGNTNGWSINSTIMKNYHGAVAVPGQGVYVPVRGGPNETDYNTTIALTRYPYGAEGSYPSTVPGATLQLTDVLGTGIFFAEMGCIGVDSAGNTYWFHRVGSTGARARVLKIDPGLTTVMLNLDVGPQEAESLSHWTVLGDGRYLLRARNTVGSDPTGRLYDISDGTLDLIMEPAIGGSDTPLGFPGIVQGVSPTQAHFTGRDAVWYFLDETTTFTPPTAQWDCNFLQGADGRIVITNGDGQGDGPIIVDLAPVTQAETGDLRAVTLDGYGRVVGNRPVNTADIAAIIPDFEIPGSNPDAGAPPIGVIDLDGGSSTTNYGATTVRYGDEGDSAEQYGVGVADLDERGSLRTVTGPVDPPGTPPDPLLWSPLALSPAVWLDSEDDLAVDLVGTNVERLLDKSGNGNHAVPPGSVGTIAPTRGAGSLGTAIIMGAAGVTPTPLRTPVMAIPNADTGLTIALVMRRTAISTGFLEISYILSMLSANLSYKLLLTGPTAGGTFGQNSVVWRLRHTLGSPLYSSDLRNQAAGELSGSPENILWVGEMSSALQRQYIDGTEINPAGVSNGAQPRTFGTWGSLMIGDVQAAPTPSEGFAPLHFTGEFYDLVVVNRQISEADRQRLEGFLAHKRGIEDNLPGVHPFKAAPPT